MTYIKLAKAAQLELNRRALKQGNKNRTRFIARAKRDGVFTLSKAALKELASHKPMLLV